MVTYTYYYGSFRIMDYGKNPIWTEFQNLVWHKFTPDNDDQLTNSLELNDQRIE